MWFSAPTSICSHDNWSDQILHTRICKTIDQSRTENLTRWPSHSVNVKSFFLAKITNCLANSIVTSESSIMDLHLTLRLAAYWLLIIIALAVQFSCPCLYKSILFSNIINKDFTFQCFTPMLYCRIYSSTVSNKWNVCICSRSDLKHEKCDHLHQLNKINAPYSLCITSNFMNSAIKFDRNSPLCSNDCGENRSLIWLHAIRCMAKGSSMIGLLIFVFSSSSNHFFNYCSQSDGIEIFLQAINRCVINSRKVQSPKVNAKCFLIHCKII